MFDSAIAELSAINWQDPTIVRMFVAVAFMPIYWNVIARLQFYTNLLTYLFGCGNRRFAVYVLAISIFCGSGFRDYLYHVAMDSNPKSKIISDLIFAQPVGYLFMSFGSVLVLSSLWKLGIVGTYLGDYFGFLMSEKVESFPFNVVDDPMYTGSSMIFCGLSLVSASWVGLACTVWVVFWYQIALLFEGPFTTMIYEKAANEKVKQK